MLTGRLSMETIGPQSRKSRDESHLYMGEGWAGQQVFFPTLFP